MKTSLLCFFLLFLFHSLYSQESFLYKNAVPTSNLSSADTYQSAKSWILRNFRPGDQIVEDLEGERIIFIGKFMLEDRSGGCAIVNGTLRYKLILTFTANEYNYSFSKLTHDYALNCGEYGGFRVSEPLQQSRLSEKKKHKILLEVDEKIKLLITEMSSTIENSPDDVGS